jgi:hypothetical protein
MSGLDAALTESATALDAVKAVVDPDDPTRKRLVVDWYKSLAKVAEQLVLLETVAADSGRPLSGPPDQFVALRESLAGSEADLTRLGRNWLGFANRTSDGVILPVTFQSSRRVGPYWSTKVSIDLAKGGVRDLVVLSRTEPAAVVGDRILLTGMAFDGDVIWAADIRPASAAAGLGSESL